MHWHYHMLWAQSYAELALATYFLVILCKVRILFEATWWHCLHLDVSDFELHTMQCSHLHANIMARIGMSLRTTVNSLILFTACERRHFRKSYIIVVFECQPQCLVWNKAGQRCLICPSCLFSLETDLFTFFISFAKPYFNAFAD